MHLHLFNIKKLLGKFQIFLIEIQFNNLIKSQIMNELKEM